LAWPGLGLAESLAVAALVATAVRLLAGHRAVPVYSRPYPGPGLAAVHSALERAGVEVARLGGRLEGQRGPVAFTFEEAPGGVRLRVGLKAWMLAAIITLLALNPLPATVLAAYTAYTAAEVGSIASRASRRAAGLEGLALA